MGTRWNRRRFLAVAVIGVCGICSLGLVSSVVYGEMTRVRYTGGRAKDYNELNGVRTFCVYYQELVPHRAKNIDYYLEVARRNPMFDASFDIAEADFLEWMLAKGWTPDRQNSIGFTLYQSDGTLSLVGPFDGICHGYRVLTWEEKPPDGVVIHATETHISDLMAAFDPQ